MLRFRRKRIVQITLQRDCGSFHPVGIGKSRPDRMDSACLLSVYGLERNDQRESVYPYAYLDPAGNGVSLFLVCSLRLDCVIGHLPHQTYHIDRRNKRRETTET